MNSLDELKISPDPASQLRLMRMHGADPGMSFTDLCNRREALANRPGNFRAGCGAGTGNLMMTASPVNRLALILLLFWTGVVPAADPGCRPPSDQ